MINLITRISVGGIAAITAALVILLSAFNGIETMIQSLYSEFDSDITIRVEKGKSFNENRISLEDLRKIEGVANVTRAIEEVVILKHEKKWVDARLVGVDSSFLQITQMQNHIIAGKPQLYEREEPMAIVGATLLDKLEGHIPKHFEHESVICYVPKRDAKIRPGKNPFNTRVIKISSSVNFNREVNAQSFIIPLELSRELMNYDDEISAIYIDAKPEIDNEDLKVLVQQQVGDDFVVKTNYEKNELIYKTSKSERVIVILILLFIFILAAFNLVASLTMLFVEKLENITTMVSFGMPRKYIFRIFFYEGLLISGKGILFGLILGYAVCLVQVYFEPIVMPNSNGEAFPINFTFADGVLIVVLVSLLSVLFSYMPVKYLIRKNVKKA